MLSFKDFLEQNKQSGLEVQLEEKKETKLPAWQVIKPEPKPINNITFKNSGSVNAYNNDNKNPFLTVLNEIKDVTSAVLQNAFWDISKSVWTGWQALTDKETSEQAEVRWRKNYGDEYVNAMQNISKTFGATEDYRALGRKTIAESKIGKKLNQKAKDVILAINEEQRKNIEPIFDEEPGFNTWKEYLYGFESVGISIAEATGIYVATGSSSAAAAFLSTIESSNVYLEAIDSGFSPSESIMVAAKSGIGTYFLEKWGLDFLFGLKGTSRILNAFKSMGAESLQETLQTFWQNLVKKFSYDEAQSLWEGMWDSAVLTSVPSFIAGLLMPGVSLNVRTLANKIKSDAGITDDNKALQIATDMINTAKEARMGLNSDNLEPRVGLTIEEVREEPRKKIEVLSLEEEAKKYESSEEFIEAQGKSIFHTTFNAEQIEKSGFKVDRLMKKDSPFLGDDFVNGIYFVEDKAIFEEGGILDIDGDVIEAKLPKDLVIETFNGKDLADFVEFELNRRRLPPNNKYNEETIRLTTEALQNRGIDGIRMVGTEFNVAGKVIHTDEIIIFDPSKIKTKSQLTDIYNQSQGVKEVIGISPQEATLEQQKDIIKKSIIGKGDYNVGEVYEQYIRVVDRKRPVLITNIKEDGTLEGWYLGSGFKVEIEMFKGVATLIPGEWKKSELTIPTYSQDKLEEFISKGFGIEVIKKIEEPKYKRIEKQLKAVPFKGFDDLTTKVLNRLKNKTAVSRQFIDGLSKMKDIRKVEYDVIQNVLAEYIGDEKINVIEFAEKVYIQLIKLTSTRSYDEIYPAEPGAKAVIFTPEYERTTLDSDARGDVASYEERIYQGTLTNRAGGIHWSEDNFPNYFAHTRFENMGAGPFEIAKGELSGVRRIIEMQSDLFQRGRLETERYVGGLNVIDYPEVTNYLKERFGGFWYRRSEFNSREKTYDFMDKEDLPFWRKLIKEDIEKRAKRDKEIAPVESFRNTWFERIVQEEIKKAEKDDMFKLQFPTGETAMMVERLIRGREAGGWAFDKNGEVTELTIDDLKVGEKVYRDGDRGHEWIISEVLDDGNFRAVPENYRTMSREVIEDMRRDTGEEVGDPISEEALMENAEAISERFSISGEVDKTNPIYQFYEKDVQKYLRKIRPDLRRITDDQGITWFETMITPLDGERPVYVYKEGIDSRTQFDVTKQEAKKILKKYFSEKEISLFEKERLTDEDGLAVFGRYHNALIEVLSKKGKVSSKVLYHEAFHAYLDLFVSRAERSRILSEIMKKEGITDKAKAEERLADMFAEYAKTGETISGRIKNFFKRIANKIKSWINKGDKALSLFSDMEFKKRPTTEIGVLDKEVKYKEDEHEELMKKIGETILDQKLGEYTKEEREAMVRGEMERVTAKVKEREQKRLYDAIRASGKIKPYADKVLAEELRAIPASLKSKDGVTLDEMATTLKENYGYDFESDSDLLEAISKEEEVRIYEKAEVVRTIEDKKYRLRLVRDFKEEQSLPDDLEKEIFWAFRPPRKRTSRMFTLLGNKDTTVPLFSEIFNQWVKVGVDTIVEPYAGAFTLVTHSLRSAVKSGLKTFNANIFDKEKYLIVKAIQDGKLKEVKSLVGDSIEQINRAILKSAAKDKYVMSFFDKFFATNPDSYIGSNKWFDFIREENIGKEVGMKVFKKQYEQFRKVFQDALNSLQVKNINTLEDAVTMAILSKITVMGTGSQRLLSSSGFSSFENQIYDKYGMINGFEDTSNSLKYAKEQGTEINIFNEDGVRFVKRFAKLDQKKIGYYLDPPYIDSASTYLKGLKGVTAEDRRQLNRFTSGESFFKNHMSVISAWSKGAKVAMTNDINAEYLTYAKGLVEDIKMFGYKEGNTDTSFISDSQTGETIRTYFESANEKAIQGQTEIAIIRDLQAQKELSNQTISGIRKAFGATEWKNTTLEQFEKIIEFIETLDKGDSLLTTKQKEGLENIVKTYGEYEGDINLLTKREVQEMFGEKTDILQGRIVKHILAELIPTVDIIEGHPILTRIIDKADILLRKGTKATKKVSKEINDLMAKAEKASPGKLFKGKFKVWTKIFNTMSGFETKLTIEEQDVVDYLKDYFATQKDRLKLLRYRKNYITHMEASLIERIYNYGILDALKSYTIKKGKDIPIDILSNLDNIIGSKKFFRFALKRKGWGKPTMDIRKIVHTYSSMSENKIALDQILLEAQAAQQLLLQDKSALWMKKYLQNLKGRGLDNNFRNSNMGWVAKVGDRIVDFGYARLLAGNWSSALKNIVGGETNSFIEEGFDIWIKGKQRFAAHPKTAIKFIQDTGVLEGSYAAMARSDLISKGKMISDIVFYGGMEIGEYGIRGTYLLGKLTNQEWSDVMAGKGDSLSDERFREIIKKISITQGIYTGIDSPLFVHTWYGRMMMQFRRWMVTDAMLLRRTMNAAGKDIKAGNYITPNTHRLKRLLLVYGMMMWLAWDLGKRGYDKARKIALAGAEIINSIFDMFPPKLIYDSTAGNPTMQTIGAIAFSFQELAHYIGVTEKPYPVEVKKGIDDLYFSALHLLGLQGKKEEESGRTKLETRTKETRTKLKTRTK